MSARQAAPGGAPDRALPAAVAWVYVAVLCACGAVYAAVPDSALGTAMVAAVAVAGVWAIGAGARYNRPPRRHVWRYLQVAMALSTLGAVVRSLGGPEDVTTPIGDMLALIGYPLLMMWLFQLLRARDPNRQDAVADGVLVGIAGLLMAWVWFLSPALDVAGSPTAVRLLEVIFPVLDAVLLFGIVRLAFLTSSTVTAMRFLVIGFLSTLVGDLLWVINTVQGGALDVGGFLDLPYLLVYTLTGASVLHPSMRVLTMPERDVIRPLPRGRLIAVSLAFGTPAVIVLTRPLEPVVDRAAVAGGIVTLAAIVLWRTVRAVNRHAASEMRLAQQATHDALTGLPNRVRLVERLEHELAAASGDPGRTVAVLFCDLDGFKFVNDSWGHPIGDELLLAAGARLRDLERESRFVARVGGDEFVVVCTWRDVDAELEPTARLLLAQFAEPFVLSVGEVFVTLSVGIALCRGRELCTPDDLIRDADTAMYEAKNGGRNRWAMFDASMRAVSTRRIRTQAELRRALERDELLVHYQPIVRVSDGGLRGYEALVRWDHPERGLVPPNEFIPIVEDTDLILPVGALVLRRAARQVVVLQRQRDPDQPPLLMAVNVAARQIRDPDFVDTVRAVLEETGCPPWALTLEITESTMVEDTQAALEKLEALRGLGVGLSVDDFGTGYSSLRYLKRFPVTSVKIDRAFVDGLGRDPDDEAIVEAVLAMAHALGLEVVAEGVETPVQRDLLRALGCDAAQGYLFGRPAPVSVRSTTGVVVPSGPKVTA